MKNLLKTGIVLLLISCTIRISAQEIKVTEFHKDLKDISARVNAVYDANGDACALIKTRTGLQNLEFSCDLEIRKIEYHDGEYWLWVSPNTQQINIEAEGIGKLEYKLPSFTEEYTVFVISLSAVLPDKIIYKDIRYFQIETKPPKAEVYSNKVFMGYSPMNISISSDTFQYEIRKKKHSTVTGEFLFNEIQSKLLVSLKKDPVINRIFMTSYIGINKYKTPFFGLQSGTIGKTGWYVSFVPAIRARKSIAIVSGHHGTLGFDLNEEIFRSQVGAPSDSYYVKLKDNNNTFYNNLRIKGGITQRIFKNTYMLLGVGLAEYTQFYRLDVIPKSNDPLLEIPLNKNFYGKSVHLVGMFCIETGLLIRISNSYLINLNISTTGLAHYFTGKPIDFLLPLEASFGIGYNF